MHNLILTIRINSYIRGCGALHPTLTLSGAIIEFDRHFVLVLFIIVFIRVHIITTVIRLP